MKIRVYGHYEFSDNSDGCNDNDNGDLTILYDVPKAWGKWNEEKKEAWLDKNYKKIDKAFAEAMYVGYAEGMYDDYEEW